MRIVPLLLSCALCAPVAAQTLYKCTVDGKVSYGDLPCQGGTETRLEVRAAPPDPDLHERLARQKALVMRLDKERRAEELAQHKDRARYARRAAAQSQRCDKLRMQQQWREEDLRNMAGPGVEAGRTKVRRAAESLARQCGR